VVAVCTSGSALSGPNRSVAIDRELSPTAIHIEVLRTCEPIGKQSAARFSRQK